MQDSRSNLYVMVDAAVYQGRVVEGVDQGRIG